jgi:hypothetical protein
MLNERAPRLEKVVFEAPGLLSDLVRWPLASKSLAFHVYAQGDVFLLPPNTGSILCCESIIYELDDDDGTWAVLDGMEGLRSLIVAGGDADVLGILDGHLPKLKNLVVTSFEFFGFSRVKLEEIAAAVCKPGRELIFFIERGNFDDLMNRQEGVTGGGGEPWNDLDEMKFWKHRGVGFRAQD